MNMARSVIMKLGLCGRTSFLPPQSLGPPTDDGCHLWLPVLRGDDHPLGGSKSIDLYKLIATWPRWNSHGKCLSKSPSPGRGWTLNWIYYFRGRRLKLEEPSRIFNRWFRTYQDNPPYEMLKAPIFGSEDEEPITVVNLSNPIPGYPTDLDSLHDHTTSFFDLQINEDKRPGCLIGAKTYQNS